MENEVLRIEHLHKVFEGSVVLKDLSLTVRRGEVIVVIGPSGCGKSTLLRCINALEDIQGGQILLDGQPVRRDARDITKMRQKIGMVFQSYDLFPHRTILQNITLAPEKVQKRPRAEAEKEAMELLERVGLADRRDDYPRQLSGGPSSKMITAAFLLSAIGENNPQYRTRVAEKLRFLGTEIDETANAKRGEELEISVPGSKLRMFVIPTNEELMIAQDTKEICESL